MKFQKPVWVGITGISRPIVNTAWHRPEKFPNFVFNRVIIIAMVWTDSLPLPYLSVVGVLFYFPVSNFDFVVVGNWNVHAIHLKFIWNIFSIVRDSDFVFTSFRFLGSKYRFVFDKNVCCLVIKVCVEVISCYFCVCGNANLNNFNSFCYTSIKYHEHVFENHNSGVYKVQNARKVGNQYYNLEYLKQRIQAESASISRAMLKNIRNSVNFRLKMCFDFHRQYSEEVV
jgi:hypothetical protein